MCFSLRSLQIPQACNQAIILFSVGLFARVNTLFVPSIPLMAHNMCEMLYQLTEQAHPRGHQTNLPENHPPSSYIEDEMCLRKEFAERLKMSLVRFTILWVII